MPNVVGRGAMLNSVRCGVTGACLAGFAAVLVAQAAWALELTDYSVTEEPKKVVLTFQFDGALDSENAQIIHNYSDNFISFSLPDMSFPWEYLGEDQVPSRESVARYYHYIRFDPGDRAGVVLLQLARPTTPDDIQVFPYDEHIVVEILKPLPAAPALEEPEPQVQPAEEPESAAGVKATGLRSRTC